MNISLSTPTPQASHELDPIVSHISNLLNDAATKHTGLLLLHQFLPQCPLDIVEQKGALWTALATKALAQHRGATTATGTATATLALRCIGHLLHKSVHVPELSKALSNTLLAKLTEALLSLPAAAHSAALALLEQAQRLHPGAASLSRAATERWILSFADSADAQLVRQSGRCLLLLQQTRGGGGAGGTAHQAAWAALQQALLGELHRLLDALFVHTPEVMDVFVASADAAQLGWPELQLSDEPVARHVQLVQRFRNVAEYLRGALVEPFPVPKAVLPAKVLGLISRGLAVNCATLAGNLIVDNIVVGALIPRVHCALFGLLDGLVGVLGTNVLPYGQHVLQLVVQSLQWTSSGRAAGAKRPFASVRIAAYQSLERWTLVARSACGVERVAAELVPLLVQDVTPFQTEVRLKVLSGAKRHMSKKARRSLHRAQNDATNLAQAHSKAFDPHNTKVVLSDGGNERLCAAALRALATVLTEGGQFLKPVVHKLLHEHVVRLAVGVLVQPDGTVGTLYASAECRRRLYAALQALVLGAHHLCPAPVQYARWVMAAAQARDPNTEVRALCAAFGRQLERIVHPQKETLQFAVEATLQRDALRELRQLGRKGGEVESSDEEEEAEEKKEETVDVKETVPEPEAAEVEVVQDIVEDDSIAAEDEQEEEEEDDEQTNGDDNVDANAALAVDVADEAENIAPRRREKRSTSPPPVDAAADNKRAKTATNGVQAREPKPLSVAAMAENAAAEAMVEDLMADFVNE